MNFSNIAGHKQQLNRLELLYSNNKIPQTMLFTGHSGIGKKLIALRFLSALFCKSDNPPCLTCPECCRIKNRVHPDFIELAPNEKGAIPIGSEEKKEPGSVRWLIDRLSRKSFGGIRCVMIDGIDNISEEGQNALLKTIEEPGSDTHIILITPGRANVLPTIISRCFEIKFNPLGDDDIRLVLAQQSIPENDINFAAPVSGGSPAVALLLSDIQTRDNILEICREISEFIRSSAIFNISLDKIQKSIGPDLLADALINIYRHNLLYIINEGQNPPPDFKDIFLSDMQKIITVLKILLALKRSQSHNVNTRIALKGMLYHEFTGTETMSRMNESNI